MRHAITDVLSPALGPSSAADLLMMARLAIRLAHCEAVSLGPTASADRPTDRLDDLASRRDGEEKEGWRDASDRQVTKAC